MMGKSLGTEGRESLWGKCKEYLREMRGTATLALPIASGHVGQMLMGWADTMMVGRLGVVPLAACAFANLVLMVPLIFGFGVMTAVSVRASLAFGAANDGAARRCVGGGWFLGVGLGLGITALSLMAMPWLSYLGQPLDVVRECVDYFLFCGISAVALMVSTASKNYSEAVGRPWVPFLIVMGSVVLNVLLNWILIFGFWVIPGMGLAGAGLATLVARCVCAGIFVYWTLGGNLAMEWGRLWSVVREFGREAGGQLRLGFAVGCQYLAEISGFSFGSLMLGWLGAEALAAHQIALTCAATTFMVSLGLSQAACVRVGQERGAGRLEACRRVAVGGLLMGASLLGLVGLGLWLGRFWIAGLFTQESGLVGLAGHLIGVAAVFQVFDSIQVVSSGILRGFEDVKVPMWAGVAAYWVVAIPVGAVAGFYFEQGAVGVWWGFCAGLAFGAVVLSLRVLSKFW